jgi:hypothetical protein
VVATSIADESKRDSATVLVAGGGVIVSIAPAHLALAPGVSASFSSTVGPIGTAERGAVTWSIEEGERGGAVDAAGTYTAPPAPGTYHVVATSAKDPTRSASATIVVTSVPALDADRRTVWSPGIIGGIPSRRVVCATLDAASFGEGSQDASAAIQAAIDACPPDHVVTLSAGTFRVDASYLAIRRGITLRGAGAKATTLKRTNGAVKGSYVPHVADPVIVIGPNRWPKPDNTTSQALMADGRKGALSVTVESGGGFAAGQFVLIDEDDYATGAWKSLPRRSGAPTGVRIWATDRAVWQKHDPPAQGVDDPFPDALSWFCRTGRPIAEIKEVASVSGNTIRFTTPLHISYRTSHAAQATRYADPHVHRAGVENLSVSGGGDGNVRFESAAYSWLKDVESTMWLGEAVAIDQSYRVEVRGSYIHDGAWSEPGGGGYAISLARGTSEVLVEDNILMQANKLMVSRAAGAGSVVGYNYVDDAHIASVPSWQEVGINASHMVGSHHVLFEGNDSFNYDADCTHGNAIYHTIFRNHLSGTRRDYTESQFGGNVRVVGLEYGAWWHSFIGNVLGRPSKMSGWRYDDRGNNTGKMPWLRGASVWKLGYDPAFWMQAADPEVQSTAVRHGNFDYVNERIMWDDHVADRGIPNSLYLTHRPQFFDGGHGYRWPWVDPNATEPVRTLPARARYEAGTPFVQP